MAGETSGTEDRRAVALRKLVAEIAAGGFQDKHGHHLTLNTAYLEAVALLELDETLQRPSRPRG